MYMLCTSLCRITNMEVITAAYIPSIGLPSTDERTLDQIGWQLLSDPSHGPTPS